MLDSNQTVKAPAARKGARGSDARGGGKNRLAEVRARGLQVPRVFSTKGVSPFDQVEWDRRKASITDDKGKVIFEAGTKPTRRQVKKAQEDGVKWVAQGAADMLGRYLADTLVDKESGEVVAEAGDEITMELLAKMSDMGVKQFNILKIDHLNVGAYIRNTLAIDKTSSPEEALVEIYKVMRPGEPPTVEAGQKLFTNLFFNLERFDLSPVGRMKMDARLGFAHKDDNSRILTKDDLVATVKKLVPLLLFNECYPLIRSLT